ncbi:MAG: c-type cytochrome [Phycisphaerales bacterium]|nr:c-type cytochrome [Phycisphaerales bacterium]
MPHRKERLLEHGYDEIREYDNPTPGWWHAIFLGSIAFSALYFAFWHGSPMAWTPQDSLAADRTAYYARVFRTVGELKADQPTMLKMMADTRWMEFGASIFAANCAACHGAAGAGLTGPNLTDDRYINVRKLEDLFTVVSEGVLPKGMPAWGNRLTQNERVLVASFAASLRGRNLTGRAPEGEVIPPWPTFEPPPPAAP